MARSIEPDGVADGKADAAADGVAVAGADEAGLDALGVAEFDEEGLPQAATIRKTTNASRRSAPVARFTDAAIFPCWSDGRDRALSDRSPRRQLFE